MIIRQTDKSKVFHLGSAEDHYCKALKYMTDTNAYLEIPSGINPFMDHLRAVLALIDPLLKKQAIDLKLWKHRMRPDVKAIELADLYFIPKPHKVWNDKNRRQTLFAHCYLVLGRYAIETDCFIHASCSYWCIPFSRSSATSTV